MSGFQGGLQSATRPFAVLEDRVRVNGVTLHFRQDGSGGDLVLTHGLGSSGRYWDRHLPALSRHHRVLCWDVRGFGHSDKPAGPYSLDLFAADLAELVRALGIADAHFAGLSMGGVITQRLALDYPDLVRSMTLVSTSSKVGEFATNGWRRLADLIETNGFREDAEAARRGFSLGFAERHPEEIAAASRETAANDPAAYAAAARAVSHYDWTEQLVKVRIPTLIMQGAEDQLTPPGGSVILSRGLPQSRLLMIAGAGHNLPIEEPALFESALLAFTAGIDFKASSG